MLFEISTLLLAFAVPIAAIAAYRQGIKDGRAIREDIPPPPLLPMFGGGVHSDPKLDTLMQNINNYDGTGAGQIDV